MLKDNVDNFIRGTLGKILAVVLGIIVFGGWFYVVWLTIAALRKYVHG